MTVKHKIPYKCKIKIVSLNSILHESNFCINELSMWALEKKMLIHQVPGLS